MISKKGDTISGVSVKKSLYLKSWEIKFHFQKRRRQQILAAFFISTAIYLSSSFFIQSNESYNECMIPRLLKSYSQPIDNIENGKTREDIETNKIARIPHFSHLLRKDSRHLGNSSCAKFPTLSDIRFCNTVWQTQVSSNWTFQMFGAYLDSRKEEINGLDFIRILGVMDRHVENISAFCQIWFTDKNQPVLSKVTGFNYLFYGKSKDASTANEFLPFLWRCPIPKNLGISEIPASVSIVESVCDNATNNLKVNYEVAPLGRKEKIAVCMKGLDYLNEQTATVLIEWIETLKLFGVHKIFLYNFYTPPKTIKVLEYYLNNGDLEISPITYPHSVPNERDLRYNFLNSVGAEDGQWLKLSLEAIPYNDCLYRNMYKYEYLTAIDVDEMIVPNKTSNWITMLENIEKTYPDRIISHFVLKNTIFLPEKALTPTDALKFGIPKQFSKIRSIYRGCQEVPTNVKWPKSILQPMKVLSVLNHYPLQCLYGVCNEQIVDPSIAKLHHYRTGFLSYKFCPRNKYIEDKSLWRWKDEIIRNAAIIMKIFDITD